MPAENASHRPLLMVLALIFLAALSRLLPHPPNFGPVAAIALTGGAFLPQRWMAWVVPFAALYASDLLLNNLVYGQYYEGFFWGVNGWVYAGFALTILLGSWAGSRGKGKSTPRLVLGLTVSTLLFFLLTNFGVWLGSGMYPRTGSGLLAAYAAGLPFLLNSALGNLLFGAVMIGAVAYSTRTTVSTESV